MSTAARWTIARHQLRSSRAATVGLVVLVGLSAAVPMALWSASRRASHAYTRFVAAADPSDSNLIVCPKEVRPGSAKVEPQVCINHRVAAPEMHAIRSDAQVRGATRFGFRLLDIGPVPDPGQLSPAPVGLVTSDDPSPEPTILGRPIIVSGRLARSGAADEAMAAEPTAATYGLHAGQHIWVRFTGSHGPLSRVTITGITRTPDGLLPVDTTSGPALFAGPAFLRAQRRASPPVYGGVAVWLDDGDLGGVVARVQHRLGQLVVGFPLLASDEVGTIEQGTDFESRAGTAVAVAAALAAVFLAGQAVSRQSRGEAYDAPVLVGLGFTRRDLIGVALLRWMPVGLAAVLVAVMATATASTLGPLGVARRGAWHRGIRLDGPVLATGGAVVLVIVLALGATGAAAHGLRRRRVPSAAPSAPFVGNPTVRTGLALAWQGLRRGTRLSVTSAVLASALAVAALITTSGGSQSLHRVLDQPSRYGAPWDAIARDDIGDLSVLARTPGVASAALIGGSDVQIGHDRSVWTQALFPVPGVARTQPVVLDGRAPSGPDEIALGRLTQEAIHAEIGDRITVAPTGDESPLHLRVVGITMVTDGSEPSVGRGALVTPAGMHRIELGTKDDATLAIAFTDGADRDHTLAALRRVLPTVQEPFPVPPSLENAERVAELPLYLALGAAALAAITFAHALILSVRRGRRDLAVYRALGFTPGQLRRAVAVEATALGLLAVAIGVPAGVIGARWGWRLLAHAFGVASQPVVSIWIVLVCTAAVLVVANLAATPVITGATRVQGSTALHTE